MSQASYSVCPHCGAHINPTAIACPECGSDADTGWSNMPADLSFYPGDDDDYQDSVRREFGTPAHEPWKPSWVAVTGFVLLMLILFVWLMR